MFIYLFIFIDDLDLGFLITSVLILLWGKVRADECDLSHLISSRMDSR